MNDDRVITLEDLSAGWPTAIQSPSMFNGPRNATLSQGEWSVVNGPIYDLQGRRLQGQPTAPGIYVNNGRKIVIK
jgi:hypothetical protein